MRPSSSTMTTPNSNGFSTLFRAMVTMASRLRWKSRMRGEVEVGERVSADDDEGVVESTLCILDRTGGAQRSLFHAVFDVHPERGAIAEVISDDLRKERDRHDHVVDAVTGE